MGYETRININESFSAREGRCPMPETASFRCGSRLVEIRSYGLLPGCKESFHLLMHTAILPRLREAGIEIITCGPASPYLNCYQLVCAHRDLEQLRERHAAIYGSEWWRTGPREALLTMIEGYHDARFYLSASSVADLRGCNAAGRFSL